MDSKCRSPTPRGVSLAHLRHYKGLLIYYRSEASIRFAGNKPPLPNCNTITLDEFYKAHTHPDYASWYFDVKSIPTHFRSLNKNHKIPLLPVELYIDTEVVRLLALTYHTRLDDFISTIIEWMNGIFLQRLSQQLDQLLRAISVVDLKALCCHHLKSHQNESRMHLVVCRPTSMPIETGLTHHHSRGGYIIASGLYFPCLSADRACSNQASK